MSPIIISTQTTQYTLQPRGIINLHFANLKAAMFKYIGNSIFHFQPYFEIIVSFNKTNVYFTILKEGVFLSISFLVSLR